MKVNEKVCPRCAEAVKLDAVVCKHCGHEFSSEEIELSKAKQSKQNKDTLFGCLGCGGLIVAAMIVGSLSMGSGNGDANAASGKDGLVANYRTVLSLAKACDPMIGAVGEAGSTGSPVAMYAAAKDGHTKCKDTWLKISDIKPADGLSDEVREKEKEALETCSTAYYLRQRALETAMNIADGDAKPSTITSVQDDLKAGQAGVLLCVGRYSGAAGAAGVSPEALR